jgi:hypothetical protein
VNLALQVSHQVRQQIVGRAQVDRPFQGLVKQRDNPFGSRRQTLWGMV